MSQTPIDANHLQAAPHAAALFANPLCAVDGSAGSLLAVEQTTALVGAGGHITVLEGTSGPDRYQSPAILPGDAAHNLEAALEIARAAGVTSRAEVDPDYPPARMIVDRAADYSMLAMGAPHTSWMAGAITASATDAAISHLPTALLIAREIGPEEGARRIVVASDGADGSDELVELARELAELQDAEVVLVHATARRRRSSTERVQAQTKALQEALGVRADVDSREGRAHEVIIAAAASLGASLIVMGSRGLHGPRAIGSVSRHVMHDAPCSVLLVPPRRSGG